VMDSVTTKTTERASAVLPSGTFAESGGTLVNSEGRAQRFFKVFVPDEAIEESWKRLCTLLAVAERSEAEKWKTSRDIIVTLAEEMDVFTPAVEAAPPPDFRIAGQHVPRQPHRCSGRTALTADKAIHEPGPPDDPDSPLSFSMEGYDGKPPAPLIARYWSPAWNSVQALNKFQSEIGVSLRGGDPGKRLIEPSKDRNILYFRGIPETFKPHRNECLFIPLYHLFGSEELSVHAPGIAELSPEPYLALNAKDAARLGIEEGGKADIIIHNRTFSLPVKISHSLAHGVAGLPSGLPSMEWIMLPADGTVSASGVRQ
jgi:NADH-quinone oxidoreductase subunit G